MITIHHEKETDFSKNGYGAIDDYIVNPNVGWELNGEFYASLEYPSFLEKASYLKNKNILRLPVPFMQDQLFRIYRTRKVLGFVQVEARHIFYDLLDNLIEDTNIVEKNGALALQQLLGATQYPHRFVGLSDIALSRTARMVRYNPVEALLDDSQANTFISRWGGELVRDNFTIRMAKQMGTDRGVHIQHKKDLTGYEATVDGSTVATRIMPTGFDGLRLPELYVDSPLLDPDNPKIKVIKYKDVKAAVGEYADDEDALPIEEAHSLLRQYAAEEYSVNHLDEPETVVSVNFVTLHNTKEYEEFAQLQEIQQGDVVKVSIPEEGFEITSRLVAFTSDPLQKNHYTSTTLGNHVLEFTTSNDEISKIRNEVNNLQDSIITVMQAANGKNRNFWGTADPNTLSLNANLGDNYTRTVGEEKILYQYVEVNGERYWSEILNTGDLDRVSREVKTAQAEAEAAKLAAEQTYTDSVAEAERIVEAQDLVYQALFEAVDNEVEQAQATANDAVNEINTAVQAAGFTTLNDTLKNQLTLANQAQQSANEAIADIGTTITELANTDTKASDALANAHVALGEVQRVEGIFYDKEILSSETGERLVYTKAEIEGNEGFVSKADYRVDADGWSAELSRVEGVALSSGANINLLVRKGELDGYYLGNDGLPSGSAVFAISARLIPVSVGESITFSKASSGFFHYGFRNSAGAFFGKVQNNANEFTITVPTGAVNLEVSYRKDTLPKVERGTIKTQWTLAPEDQVNQSNIVYLEGLVSQTAEALTSVYTKTEIDGQLGTKLPTAVHNTFAQQTADSFAQTAKLTELNSALGRLSEAEAGIASNALSINLKASQTEFSGLKSTVENMKIGGRNYYSNLSTKVSRLVGTARKIQKNTINGFDLKGDHTDLLNVRVENVIKSAGWWTVSFDVRVKSGANNSTFTFQVVDNSRVVTVTLTSQNWVRVEQAFDVTRHSDIFNFVDIDGLRYFEYEFRNFKVEKGNKATDWTPAPEDDAVLISKLESDLTIESGRINALSTKVNANESFIGQLTVSPDGIVGTVAEINNITQKIAKISVTEQLVNGLQTTVGDADTGLVSQVNQIAGGLQSVVTDFENISIGGTNLINGSKTFGPTFLAQRYNLTTLVTNTWDPFGKSSPILHTVNSSPDGVSKNYLRIMNVVKEKAPHTFSVWARRYQGIGSAVPVSISIGDDRDDNVIMIGATWEKHVVHYTPYRDVNTFNFLQIRHLQYDNFRIEWFNPKLEVGTIASDWSHSLDDLATMDYVGSEISQLQNNINFRVSKNDVINQINISTEGILLAGKKIHITGQTTIDTAVIKSAHIDTLNVSKLTGTVAEFVTLSSKVITADSITSIHIKSENALIDKLFATSALIDRLTSKTAFITSIKAIDISADRITAGTLNAANVNIINLNVSSLVGNKSNFVETAFNAINSNISINGDRLLVVHSNGSQTRIDANGLHHIEGGVSYRTHYLTEVGRISVNTSNLAITEGVLVTLPAIFKGKPFKVSVSISDVLSYEHPQYNNLAIQRIVSFPSQGSINHANGTFKIYGYARTINYKTDNVIHVPVQVQYTVTV